MEVKRDNCGHIQWTDELINYIVTNADNISKVHRETGIRKQTISNKLNELQIFERTKGCPKKYHVNEMAFDDITTKEQAYYIGLIAADGSLNRNSSLIRLGLHENDKEMLEQFNNFIQSDRPIFQSTGSAMCEACINSFHMQNSLLKIGICYNKSYDLNHVDIPEMLMKSFILGLFDGDGSLSLNIQNGYKHYAFRLIGTYNILQQVLPYLYIYDNKYYLTLAHRCDQTYELRVIGNYRVYNLMKDLYTNGFDKPLKRKHDRFLDLENMAPRERNFSSKLS